MHTHTCIYTCTYTSYTYKHARLREDSRRRIWRCSGDSAGRRGCPSCPCCPCRSPFRRASASEGPSTGRRLPACVYVGVRVCEMISVSILRACTHASLAPSSSKSVFVFECIEVHGHVRRTPCNAHTLLHRYACLHFNHCYACMCFYICTCKTHEHARTHIQIDYIYSELHNRLFGAEQGRGGVGSCTHASSAYLQVAHEDLVFGLFPREMAEGLRNGVCTCTHSLGQCIHVFNI